MAADASRGVSLWLAGVMTLAVFSLQVVPVLAPAIAADTGLAPAFVGAWNAGLWAAALVGTLVAPALLSRTGAWTLAQGCLLLCAAGATAVASGQVAGLVAGAVLIGLGHGLEGPMASHLLAAHVAPARRALWFSVKQTGVQVGAVAGSFMLPPLALWVGWRASALVAVVLALLMTVALSGPKHDHAVAPALVAGGRLQALSALGRMPVLRWLSFAGAAFAATQTVLNGFFVTYAVTERGASLVQAGAWLGAAQAGGLVGRLLWGWVAGRLGTITPLLLGLGVVTAACAVLLGTGGPAWALLVVFGLTASGWNGIFLAEVAHQVPAAEAGSATAAVMVVMMLGLVGGPLVFSALGAAVSFSAAFVAFGGVAAAGCAALLRARVLHARSAAR